MKHLDRTNELRIRQSACQGRMMPALSQQDRVYVVD